jgi:hypothetical protein
VAPSRGAGCGGAIGTATPEMAVVLVRSACGGAVLGGRHCPRRRARAARRPGCLALAAVARRRRSGGPCQIGLAAISPGFRRLRGCPAPTPVSCGPGPRSRREQELRPRAVAEEQAGSGASSRRHRPHPQRVAIQVAPRTHSHLLAGGPPSARLDRRGGQALAEPAGWPGPPAARPGGGRVGAAAGAVGPGELLAQGPGRLPDRDRPGRRRPGGPPPATGCAGGPDEHARTPGRRRLWVNLRYRPAGSWRSPRRPGRGTSWSLPGTGPIGIRERGAARRDLPKPGRAGGPLGPGQLPAARGRPSRRSGAAKDDWSLVRGGFRMILEARRTCRLS